MSEFDISSIAASVDDVASIEVHKLPRDSFLRCLLETLPDAMIVIDHQGLILCFSPGAERMFGYAESEVIGRNVSVLMALPDGQWHDAFIGHYLKTGQRHVIGKVRLARALHRSGRKFPVDLAIGEAVVDGHTVFTGFMHDLTEREKTIEETRMLQAELAQVSRVSSMGLLASAIAHELNQPLSAIASYTETLKAMVEEGEDDRELTLEALENCTLEVQRAGAVIKGLRSFLARGEVARSEISLRKIIADAVMLALLDGEGEGIELNLDYDLSADIVVADRVQIQQVVFNLVRNAREAILGRNTQVINISTRRRDLDLAEIIVSDNGAGVEPSMLKHVFRPFNSTKGDGMGIGLSICQAIVESHDGRIWIEASPLGGASFHVVLPMPKEDQYILGK